MMVDANQQWDRATAQRFGRILEQALADHKLSRGHAHTVRGRPPASSSRNRGPRARPRW
ncbi:hypothetical protein [Streptomyces inhibens]|uniref:hypothetical protein n=1 Tax=Streptomyces inhibens TaxID=2293571 RepID=UPI00315B1C9F